MKNKLRTVITMIGVWWGILLLIGLLGSVKGIETSLVFNLEIMQQIAFLFGVNLQVWLSKDIKRVVS